MESAQHSIGVRFQVVVTGVKDDSTDGRKQLRENFAAKFKLAPEKVDKLLSKLPATVKVEPERMRADRWIPILEGLGAVASVRQVGDTLQVEHEKEQIVSTPKIPVEIQATPAQGQSESSTHELRFVESEPVATEDQVKDSASAEEQFQLTNLMQLVGDNAAPRFDRPATPTDPASASSGASVEGSPQANDSAQTDSITDGSAEPAQTADPEQTMGKMESFIPRVNFNPTSTKLPSRKFISICAAGSVAFLLALAGIMSFGPAPSTIELSSQDIKQLLADQKKILAGKAVKDQTKELDQQLSKASEFTGEFISGPYSGKIAIKVDGEKILTLSMDLTGRASEKLTPELLVAGHKRSPWLAKLEVPVIKADLARLDLPALTIRGIGKAYLDDDAGSARYAADLSAVGKPGQNPDQMELKIVVSNTSPIPTEATETKIERLKGDRFAFVIPLEAVVSRKVPSASAQQSIQGAGQPVAQLMTPPAAQTPPAASATEPAKVAEGPLPVGDTPAAQQPAGSGQ